MLRFALTLAFLTLPLSACGQTAAPAQAQAGETYELAPKPGPWQAEKGKIEVVEYFSYTCGHCAHFQPMVDGWKKNMPKDVVFRYVPAAFDIEFPYSRAFFAAEAAGGLPKVHNDLFVAIHEDGRVPRNATIDELAAYLAQRGLNREKMSAAMRSVAVTEQMQRAKQFVIDKRLSGTPVLVVAGKYVIKGESYREYLENLDKTIAMERANRAAAPKAGSTKPAAKPAP